MLVARPPMANGLRKTFSSTFILNVNSFPCTEILVSSLVPFRSLLRSLSSSRPQALRSNLWRLEEGQVVVEILGQVEAVSRDDTLVVVPTYIEDTICDAA